MNQSLACPACHRLVPWRALRRDDVVVAPCHFGVAWPRCYCPHCGVQLRSNTQSLTVGLLLIGGAMILFGVSAMSSGPWPHRLVAAAFVAVALAAPVALWLHRFVVVPDRIRTESRN